MVEHPDAAGGSEVGASCQVGAVNRARFGLLTCSEPPAPLYLCDARGGVGGDVKMWPQSLGGEPAA